MGKNTEIEWCHHTFNPWVGCTRISPACDHCYAEGWARRTGQAHLWTGERRRTTESNWYQPLKWDRAAATAGIRQRVFCASLADVFDNQVPPEWRADLFQMIEVTHSLDWMLLTKRPQNIAKMLPMKWLSGLPPQIWIGTTIEDRARLVNADHLRKIPAAVRFLSIEPLLEDLGQIDLTGIHLVIVGGESGPGARPMHPAWVRSIRDQCAAAGIAFLFKQWGEWAPSSHGAEVARSSHEERIWRHGEWTGHALSPSCVSAPDTMNRVGKKVAGRLLDGIEHNGMPASAV